MDIPEDLPQTQSERYHLKDVEDYVGLIIHVNEASDLDPATGGGQGVVELTYNTPDTPDMGQVKPLEFYAQHQVLKNKQGIVFQSPATHIRNGYASWGSMARLLKLHKSLCLSDTIEIEVRVWQVNVGTGSTTIGGLGFAAARVLLGECKWHIPCSDIEMGLSTTTDSVLELTNAWNEAYEMARPDIKDVTGKRVDPKLILSWRFEKLRGYGSDNAELTINRLPFSGHSYAHGGFMGAAISLMEEEKWREILQDLETEHLYSACQMAYQEKGLQRKLKLMALLENSPVLCAYGLTRTGSTTLIHNKEEMPATRSTIVTGSTGRSLPSSMRRAPAASMRTIESGREMAMIEPSEDVYAMMSDYKSPRTTRLDTFIKFKTVSTQTNISLECYRWKMYAKRLLLIHKRWRSAIRAVIKQCRISNSWEKMQAGCRVNPYGYAPTALEWDLWVHPSNPGSLEMATVDHGSPAALVQQAIFTTLGLKSCAGLLGSKHIHQKGIPPVHWLTNFGEALNAAINYDKEKPLPLHPNTVVESFYEFKIKVLSASDLMAMDITNTSDPYCKVHICGNMLYRKPLKTSVKFSTLDPEWNEELTIWPVDTGENDPTLVIEVWDYDATSGDDFMGCVEIPLDDLKMDTPVECNMPLTPKEEPTISKLDREVKISKKSSRPSKKASSKSKKSKSTKVPQAKGTISFEILASKVDVITAATRFGIPRHAFQTCLAMLADPGGLFLDVKSAYSKPEDLALFCTTLRGIGITVKSVCSFSQSQLNLPTQESRPFPVNVVRFFHGLSGLENACDNGHIEPHTRVLFNGASFLMDPSKGESEGGMVTMAKLGALDTMYINRYQALAETYNFLGGIYVQEPDCCATCVEALTTLVSHRPDIFPLGFAYGHVPGFAVSALAMTGRGFASQQIVEEFQARAELSTKVQKSIKEGKNKGASLAIQTSWLERLLYGSNFLMMHEQVLVLQMFNDIESDTSLSRIVASVGGVERIFLRFFEHYEATTPFTIHETGFNFNHTKTLCRLFRDRGVFERLPLDRKESLARFFTSQAVYGFGLTYVFQKKGCRKSIHKFAKEGLACLLESTTKDEFEQVLTLLGGFNRVLVYLNGSWKFSKSYSKRMAKIREVHKVYPDDAQYIADMVIFRVSGLNRSKERDYTTESRIGVNQRLKVTARETAKKTNKAFRKTFCCMFTGLYVTALSFFTLSLFAWFFAVPRTLWPYWGRGWNKNRLRGIMIIVGVALIAALISLVIAFVIWHLLTRV